MDSIKFICLIFLIYFFFFGTAFSFSGDPDTKSLKFKLIDNKVGLSHNQINCILKDEQGFIWIGTVSGLNRFDGLNIKNYFHDSRDTSSLIGNHILKLFQDPFGNMWIHTQVGYCIYDPQTGQFHKNTNEILSRFSLHDAILENIIIDVEGSYWFITSERGIVHYDPEKQTSVSLMNRPGDTFSLSSDKVSDIVRSSEGNIWVVHHNGVLELLDGKTFKVIYRNIHIREKFNYKEDRLFKLMVDSDNDLWIYTPSDYKGAYLLKYNQDSLIHFSTSSAHSYRLNSNIVNGIVEDNKGNIWIGTDHGGINLFNKSGLDISYVNHTDCKGCLAQNSLNLLYKDNEGIIWLGTFKRGVNYFHENIIKFDHNQHDPEDKNSLPYNDINKFVEDKDGNLWIGTNGGGLVFYDRMKNKYSQYRHDPQNPNSLSSDVIVSLLLDKENNLWIGTYYGGLNKFDGKKFVHYKHDEQNPQSIIEDSIWELYQDKDGDIWVGTLRNGIGIFDPEKERFMFYNANGGENFINNNYITSIIEGPDGNIWVGGYDGIDIISKEKGLIKFFKNNPQEVSGIGSNTILCLYKDRSGNIWIGTQEGLSFYNSEKKVFFHFNKEDGLPDNIVLNVVEHKTGDFWLSTSSGVSNLKYTLSKAGKPLISFINYDELDGLQGKAFNEKAALRLSSGELIFGGPNGFNLFDPDNIARNEKSPKIIFTDFQLFNKSVPVNTIVNDRILLEQSLSTTDEITLKYYENVFSIGFSGLNFQDPQKNKYKYKMHGFDDDWVLADHSSKRATYTNLHPGTYFFQVIAANGDGSWDTQGARIKIVVQAPFWKTNVAYAFYISLFIAFIIYYRNRMVKKTRKKFMIEQERREAKQLHELDLMKIKFFTNVSHEFRTPLSLILASLENVFRNKIDPGNEKHYDMIGRNAKRLLTLVNQLLDIKKVEVGKLSFYPSDGDIVSFLKDIVYSFSDLSEKKDISLSFTTDLRELYVTFDPDKLEKIMFNLLSNSFKYTPENGNVIVSIKFDQGRVDKILEIKVKDTGIGIPREYHEKIFEQFFQAETPGSIISQGSGIGLSITREFVRVHGGNISVESEMGKGSCFTVTIPVKMVCCNKEDIDADKYECEKHLKIPTQDGDEQKTNQPAPLILVVEDNDDFRSHLCNSFNGIFKVVGASNGLQGWQKALAIMPDLIISDLMMPGMNGNELCKKIKSDPRTSHIPVVILSALSANEQKISGLNVGANDYITKPFNIDFLITKVKNIIGQRKKMEKAYVKRISAQASEVEIVSLDDKLIRDAIKVVEDHISDPDFSVEIMSRQLGLSRVHLYKKMLTLTGKSPLEFIRKIRIQRAAQYLEKSQLTVAEVAYKVGFNNRKYFTKYFKEEYNILPSLYQENIDKA